MINKRNIKFNSRSFAIDSPILTNPMTLEAINYPKMPIKLVNLKSFENLNTQEKKKLMINISELFIMPHHEYVQHQDNHFQVFSLTKENCDNFSLIGQLGLFAKKEIKQYQIIGFYSGIYVETWADFQYVLNDYNEVLVGRYGNSCRKNGVPVILGHYNGNYTSLINDWRPIEWYNLSESNLEIAKNKSYNTNSIIIRSGAFYFIVYIAKETIAANQQIITDYGVNYWNREKELKELFDKNVQKF